MVLKHVRGGSYETLEREVRANMVYGMFTRIGAEKVPDAKTMEKKVVRGRRLRVDTTVVETDIHYPTDSSLLGDGVRVLTRAMKRMAQIAGRAGTRLRDRTRAVGYRVRQIALASRSRVPQQGQERLKASY